MYEQSADGKLVIVFNLQWKSELLLGDGVYMIWLNQPIESFHGEIHINSYQFMGYGKEEVPNPIVTSNQSGAVIREQLMNDCIKPYICDNHSLKTDILNGELVLQR